MLALTLVSLLTLLTGCGSGGSIFGGANIPEGAMPPLPPGIGGGGGGTGILQVDLVFSSEPAKTANAINVNFPATQTVIVHVLDRTTHRDVVPPVTKQRPPGALKMSIEIPGLAPGDYDVFVKCLDAQGNSAGFSIPEATVVANETVTVVVTGTVTLISFTVTPATASIVVGATQQFTATATFSDAPTVNHDVTALSTWSITDAVTKRVDASAYASIGTSTGLATGLANGVSQVTATLGVLSGTAYLTVTGGSTPLPLLVTDYGRVQVLSFYEQFNPADSTTTCSGWQAYGTFGQSGSGYSQLQFNNLYGAAHGANGLIYVADVLNNCVTVFDKDNPTSFTRIPNTAPTSGSALGEFNSPYAVHRSAFDGKIYVADRGNGRIVRFTEGANPVFEAIVVDSGVNKQFPTSVCTDSQGRVYYGAVTDLGVGFICRIPNNWTGSPTPVVFGPPSGTSGYPQDHVGEVGFFDGYPSGVRVDEQLNIYACDGGNSRVVRFNDDGSGQIANWTTFGSNGTGVGQFESYNAGLELLSNNRMLITDTYNSRVIITTRMSTTGWTQLGTTATPAQTDVPFEFGYPIQQ